MLFGTKKNKPSPKKKKMSASEKKALQKKGANMVDFFLGSSSKSSKSSRPKRGYKHNLKNWGN